MSTFNDREHAFENQFAHDEELRFKAIARRNKLLGLWAAELLGKTGQDAATYAAEVVAADFERTGHEDVFEKVRRDFDAASVNQTDVQIREHMIEFLSVAVDQVRTQ